MSRPNTIAAVTLAAALGILAAGETALALTDPGPSRSSKDLDVVVQDEAGYQHFLVFEASPSRIPSWSRYRAEFWVDDWVSVNTSAVRQLRFETGSGLSAGFVSSRVRRNRPPHPDTVILEFEADRAVLETLAVQHTEAVDWMMDSGDVTRFRVLDPAALSRAASLTR